MTCNDTYRESVDLLKKLIHPKGFLASTQDIDNYRRAWSRDGIIAGIAGLLTEEDDLSEAFKNTLHTLKEHQDHTGRIASNVSLDGSHVSYGTTVGRIDATLWYVVGCCQYYLKTEDRDFWEDSQQSIEKALTYLECLELNGRGLIYVPQGGDWADEYVNEGYVLYDEVLYYISLTLYTQCTEDSRRSEKAETLGKIIVVNYLPKKECMEDPHVYHKDLYERVLERYTPPLPLPYFSAHGTGTGLDTFATGLLLLSGLVPKDDAEKIQSHLQHHSTISEFPILPAFDPVIDENHEKWNAMRSNFLFNFKNKPHHFHNGGRWPLVHGFFLATLPPDQGTPALEAFAKTLAASDYRFPEYYHGETWEPCGTEPLGFSAAAYILAHQSLTRGVPIFNLTH